MTQTKQEREWEFLVKQQGKLQSAMDQQIQEINETERALAGQLILISTVAVTVMGAIMGLARSIVWPPGFKYLFVLVLILLVLSLFFGVAHYFASRAFITEWLDSNEAIVRKLAYNELQASDLLPEVQKQADNLPKRSSQAWLRGQVGLIVMSFILIVVMIAGILLSN